MIQSRSREISGSDRIIVFAKEFDKDNEVVGKLQVDATGDYVKVQRGFIKSEEDYTELLTALDMAYNKFRELKK